MKNTRTKADKNAGFSPEPRPELKAPKGRPGDRQDASDSSPGELALIRTRARKKHPKKKMFSLRLEAGTIEWWQQMGAGYTSVMARFLDEAQNHPEWIKSCL